MEIYEYFKTCLNVIMALITQDVLICLACVFLGLLIVWVTLSLVFGYEMDFRMDCEKVSRYLKVNKVTRDNYAEFTSLFLTMSTNIRRSWKSYELCVSGMPSDYLKQVDCLDLQINGGYKKQGRGIMNFCIYTMFVFLAVVSFAISSSYGSVFTNAVFVEGLLMPLIAFFVYKLVYYIYLAIKSYQYKLAVESFNDMIDILDERVSLAEIFDGYENAITMVSNVYSNETLNNLKAEENRETLKNIKLQEQARKLAEAEREKEERMLAIVQERERAEIERKMKMIEKIKSTLPQEVISQEKIDAINNENLKAVAQKKILETKVEQKLDAKRGRGRPKKINAEVEKKEEKRGRGRPKKVELQSVTEEKRGRGRPKKVQIAETAELEKVVAAQPRMSIMQEKIDEVKITNQKQFVNAMNEVERLLDANAVPTISARQIESNNARIDELVEKMMTYKQNHGEE